MGEEAMDICVMFLFPFIFLWHIKAKLHQAIKTIGEIEGRQDPERIRCPRQTIPRSGQEAGERLQIPGHSLPCMTRIWGLIKGKSILGLSSWSRYLYHLSQDM